MANKELEKYMISGKKLKSFSFIINIGIWFAILTFAFSFILEITGVVFNDTKSIPKGVYIKTDHNLSHGNFVMFCGNDDINFKLAEERNYFGTTPGRCPNNRTFLMKEIVAIKGDKVLINLDGIYVNDVLIPNTKPLNKDIFERELYPSAVDKILEDKEYIVVGRESEFSFDSRYFGIITEDEIISTIQPVILEESFNEIVYSGKT